MVVTAIGSIRANADLFPLFMSLFSDLLELL